MEIFTENIRFNIDIKFKIIGPRKLKLITSELSSIKQKLILKFKLPPLHFQRNRHLLNPS